MLQKSEAEGTCVGRPDKRHVLSRTHIALPSRLARRLGPQRMPPGGEPAV